MTVETLATFGQNGNPVQPVIIAVKGEDGVIRVAKTDPTTGALLVTGDIQVEIPPPPAPEGAATEVKQDAQIVLETSIDGKLPALVGGKIPVDAAVTISGVATEAKQDTGNASLSSIDGKFTTLNAKDFATSAKQDTGNASLSSIDGKITACNTGAVTISAALPAGTNNIGDVDVLSLPALPAGTNNIGDVDVLTLPSLPAGTNNIGKVVHEGANRTPTTTSVASSATSVTILASNSNRRGVSVSNQSTAKLYLSFTNPATIANSFIEMPAGSFLLLDHNLIVTNALYGLWASANGTAQITEYV